MSEVSRQEDGRDAVHDVGGIALDNVVGVFDNQHGAEEWLLDHALKAEANDNASM